MIRKMSFIATIISMVTLFSFVAFAAASGSSTQEREMPRRGIIRCSPMPTIKVNQPTTFNSQALGSGVDVSWVAERKPDCQIKSFEVDILLQTAKGDTLQLEQTVSGSLSKARFIVPASKVHIFFASDARLKIVPKVTPKF